MSDPRHEEWLALMIEWAALMDKQAASRSTELRLRGYVPGLGAREGAIKERLRALDYWPEDEEQTDEERTALQSTADRLTGLPNVRGLAERTRELEIRVHETETCWVILPTSMVSPNSTSVSVAEAVDDYIARLAKDLETATPGNAFRRGWRKILVLQVGVTLQIARATAEEVSREAHASQRR